MAVVKNIWWQSVPGDAISGTNSGSDTLLVRGGIFLVCLLVFVVLCGLAWRNIPALRAFIPEFKPGESSLEARMAEKKRQREAELAAQDDADQLHPNLSKVVAGPDLSKRPRLNNSQSLPLTTLAKPGPDALPLASELASNDKRIEAALADGTPGTLIHAASDLDGSIHHAPIMIVQREDEPNNS